MSLYLRSLTRGSVSLIADPPLSRDWHFEVEQMVNGSHEIPFSGYCTAERETIRMILYMLIYKG